MAAFRYVVVDVFSTEPLAGNPLAVFTDAATLDDSTMQKIARELNLAETAFVFPPTREDCLARVRIFTPAKEMMFAGHPTIGSAFVLLQEGVAPEGAGSFLLQEEIGAVPIRIEREQRPLIWLRMPRVSEGRSYDETVCAKALGLGPDDVLPLKPQVLSAGNPTLVVAAKDKASVDRAFLDAACLKPIRATEPEPFCVYVFAQTADGVYARMFADDYGIYEDPATGSSMGPLAVFMMQHNLISPSSRTRFVCEQGTKMGRRSLIQVDVRGGEEGIFVGGYVTPIVEAVMTLCCNGGSCEPKENR